jgi:lipopolysaccharide/colanic/teichoic acid biosynthesis glycosyltransferase
MDLLGTGNASGESRAGAAALAPPGSAHPPATTRIAVLTRALERRRDVLLGPLAAGIVLGWLARPGDPLRSALLGIGAFAFGAVLARRIAPHAALLPLMRRAQPLLGPCLAVIIIAALEVLTGTPPAGPLDLLAALAAAVCLTLPLGARGPGSLRTAFIGSAEGAERLRRALVAGGAHTHSLVGWVGCEPLADDAQGGEGGVRCLGPLNALAELVVAEEIDLLVLGSEAPRLAVFGEVTETCLELPVRLVELAALCEEVFGHVATGTINATWFQWLADPERRLSVGPVKRAIDVVAAAVLLVVLGPLLGVLILLVRRDGGAGVFTQVRIGERGRPFRLHKLRTMRVDAGATAQWAAPEDPRITRIGAFLRRTHLDELPQLLNVLRGEMSLVGPRPEQPEFVERLERALPFYQRRHLMRPGITGWAQIRCGYAGSDIGSAWKLCHDLYYAKHRSLGLDLLILFETLSTLVFEREPIVSEERVAYVGGGQGG